MTPRTATVPIAHDGPVTGLAVWSVAQLLIGTDRTVGYALVALDLNVSDEYAEARLLGLGLRRCHVCWFWDTHDGLVEDHGDCRDSVMPFVPTCRRHDQVMLLRPDPTPEAVWCGIWYDCPAFDCHNSRLIPSTGLVQSGVVA